MTAVKKITYCIGIVTICAMGACNKSTNTPINADLIKYFDYKVGTYWIMKDSISGRVDSFFVTNNQFYSTFNASQQDDIGIEISEYTNGIINPDGLLWGINLVSSNSFYLDIASPGSSFEYITNDQPLFDYPFIATPPTTNLLPTYTIFGNTYSNVYEINHNEGPTADDWFYINATVGFIKIRLSHPAANINYVWELQRYNIVY